MKTFEQMPVPEITPEKEKLSWVQDVEKNRAGQMIVTLTDEMYEESGADEDAGNVGSRMPQGSEYRIGPSKSGNENEVGIYFFDPTAQKEKE